MKKIFLFLMLFLLSSVFVFSSTVKGGISYTIDTVRNIAFEGIDKQIDMSKYSKYFIDLEHNDNLKALKKNKLKYMNKWLTKFSDGTYAVIYLSDKDISYYYSNTGKLEYIALDIRQENEYPFRSVKYKIDGTLDAIALYISRNEQYVFQPNGKFSSHWIGENCYNEKGELIDTRK